MRPREDSASAPAIGRERPPCRPPIPEVVRVRSSNGHRLTAGRQLNSPEKTRAAAHSPFALPSPAGTGGVGAGAAGAGAAGAASGTGSLSGAVAGAAVSGTGGAASGVDSTGAVSGAVDAPSGAAPGSTEIFSRPGIFINSGGRPEKSGCFSSTSSNKSLAAESRNSRVFTIARPIAETKKRTPSPVVNFWRMSVV